MLQTLEVFRKQLYQLRTLSEIVAFEKGLGDVLARQKVAIDEQQQAIELSRFPSLERWRDCSDRREFVFQTDISNAVLNSSNHSFL